MSDKVKGVVQKITKNKGWSVLMEDEQWYGAGFGDAPTFKEGDIIEFEVSYNGRFKNIDNSTVKIVSEGVAEPQKPAAPKASRGAGGGSGGVINRDDYWTKKAEKDLDTQKEIRLQASRNAAINFVQVLLEKELVKLPTKVADKVPSVEQMVRHYTELFYDETLDIVNSDGPLGSETAAVSGNVGEGDNSNDYE